jgi:hypothetical protein
MGNKLVLYTTSTSAESSNVLKSLDFTEDQKKSCFIHAAGNSVKIYVVWGKSPYYPEIMARLDFAPRVQIHLKSKDQPDQVDYYAHETVSALRNLDPETRIRLFDPESGGEIDT